MKKFVSTALIAAFASGSMFAAPASAQSYNGSGNGSDPAVRLVAFLDGPSVTYGGDPDGTGTFTAVVDVEQRRLCYDLGTTNIDSATYAHIHEGVAGDLGRPVLSLRIDSERCSSLDQETVDSLVANPGDFYVDVLNSSFAEGAIRGQLGLESNGG